MPATLIMFGWKGQGNKTLSLDSPPLPLAATLSL